MLYSTWHNDLINDSTRGSFLSRSVLIMFDVTIDYAVLYGTWYLRCEHVISYNVFIRYGLYLRWCLQGSLFTNKSPILSPHGYVTTCPVKCGIKALSNTLKWCNYLSVLGLKWVHAGKKGPRRARLFSNKQPAELAESGHSTPYCYLLLHCPLNKRSIGLLFSLFIIGCGLVNINAYKVLPAKCQERCSGHSVILMKW